ncbi:carboxymuconolactone decarboxylase family protein [Thermomonospora echinospora]|nr:carboxymuconolactone decarboxylase family protein [Thermomonospora echinospora]
MPPPLAPRLAPLEEGDWDDVLKGVVATAGPLNVFATLGRHRELFASWLEFSSMLLLRGTLSARVRELAILRTARNSRCAYEWAHHVPTGREAGLTDDEIVALGGALDAHAWAPQDWAVVAAADELHNTGTLSDAVWTLLARRLDERGLIELVMLIGHHRMLAYALNTLRVQPDAAT